MKIAILTLAFVASIATAGVIDTGTEYRWYSDSGKLEAVAPKTANPDNVTVYVVKSETGDTVATCKGAVIDLREETTVCGVSKKGVYILIK